MNTRLGLLSCSIATLSALALVACSSDSGTTDSGTRVDTGAVADTGGVSDTGARDVGSTDTGGTGATSFSAVLSGTQENPSVSTAAGGMATFTLNGNTLSYHITHTVANATAAHIHEAPIGMNGDVRFPLMTASSQDGMITLTDAQVVTLRASGFYVNVHSGAHPGGEIRGQIMPR